LPPHRRICVEPPFVNGVPDTIQNQGRLRLPAAGHNRLFLERRVNGGVNGSTELSAKLRVKFKKIRKARGLFDFLPDFAGRHGDCDDES
jgi:hypothetical protein